MFKGKIVKFFTKTLVGRVVDKTVLGGAITNVTEKTPRTENGSFDYKEFVLELLTTVLPVMLIIALIKGWLTIEQIKELVKILTDLI